MCARVWTHARRQVHTIQDREKSSSPLNIRKPEEVQPTVSQSHTNPQLFSKKQGKGKRKNISSQPNRARRKRTLRELECELDQTIRLRVASQQAISRFQRTLKNSHRTKLCPKMQKHWRVYRTRQQNLVRQVPCGGLNMRREGEEGVRRGETGASL